SNGDVARRACQWLPGPVDVASGSAPAKEDVALLIDDPRLPVGAHGHCDRGAVDAGPAVGDGVEVLDGVASGTNLSRTDCPRLNRGPGANRAWRVTNWVWLLGFQSRYMNVVLANWFAGWGSTTLS